MTSFDCDNLLHPFQYDTGTNQLQRMLESPLQSDVKIDGRSMADLLHFFSQLAAHINFYDKQLLISDWKPFFQKVKSKKKALLLVKVKTGTQKW